MVYFAKLSSDSYLGFAFCMPLYIRLIVSRKKHLFRCFTIPHLDMGCSSFARVRRERESLFSRSTSRLRKLSLFKFDYIEFSSLSTKSGERAAPKSVFSVINLTIHIIIMTQCRILGKFEYTRGPIFKVEL